MISSTYISGASNLIYSGFWLLVDLSSFVGKNLVNQILVVVGFITHVLALFTTFLQVLFEDSVVFYQDITDNLACFIVFVADCVVNFREDLITFSTTLTNAVTTIPNFFCKCISLLFMCFSASAAFLKGLIVLIWDGLLLIGSSFWLAVTQAPLGIIYIFTKLMEQLQRIPNGILTCLVSMTDSVFSGIQNILHFIYNIPYSSVLGLVLSIVFFYGVVKNFKILCSFTLHLSVICYQCLWSYVCNLWTGHFLEQRTIRQNYDLQDRIMEDKLCVICQDRLKEVIVLPCRHVCLCLHCKMHMENQRACPICRTNIQSMMKVYI